MAFFQKFYEPLARINPQLLVEFAQWTASPETHKLILKRNEFCFEKGGRLICPLHQCEIQNDEAWAAVKPIIDFVNGAEIPLLEDRVPFRVEVSILLPHAEVEEHQDQHLMHLLCERVHVPIVTNELASFYSRWFTETDWTTYQMKAGGIYRINNRVPHKVISKSDKHRVHIIIDYIRTSDLELYKDNLNELDDRYVITSMSDTYWYRGPKT